METSVKFDDVLTRVTRFYPKTDIPSVLHEKHSIYRNNEFYRPIELVILGSNECSVSCHLCGLNSAPYGSKQAKRIFPAMIFDLLEQAVDNGFLSYLCSFEAEPFLNLALLEQVISRFQGLLDPSKINTNCSEFTSIVNAKKLFRRLKNIGWSNTSFFIPVLALSVGIQQNAKNRKPVPYNNIINGIIAFHTTFTHKKEALLAISHYYENLHDKEQIDVLSEKFYKATGEKIEDFSIIKSREIILTGKAKLNICRSKNIEEAVNIKNCFKLSYDSEFLSPTLEIDLDYNFSRRSLCCYHSFGKYPATCIHEAIQNANHDFFFFLHTRGGTKYIYKLIKDYFPQIQNYCVIDGHHACGVLYQVLKENPYLQELIYNNLKTVKNTE